MCANDPLQQVGFSAMSQREIEILNTFQRGYSGKRVAQQLAISYETVRTHQKNIYRKLGVNSLIQALLVYQRENQTS